MCARLLVTSTLLTYVVAVLIVCCSSSQLASSEQIQLTTVLPKLQAIHEDTKNLLLKNSELKSKIQVGVKLQQLSDSNQQPKQPKTSSNNSSDPKKFQPAPGLTVSPAPKPAMVNNRGKVTHGAIDYMELEEFNEWVDMNLDYAVKNTKASIDALKEEAHQNNGTIEYSEQAVQDGIEGVRYWQSAVIFQDKTLKNEKFQVED